MECVRCDDAEAETDHTQEAKGPLELCSTLVQSIGLGQLSYLVHSQDSQDAYLLQLSAGRLAYYPLQ